MAQHYAQPHEIPKQLEFTLYLTYGVGPSVRGRIGIHDYWHKPDEENPRRKSRFDRDYEKVLLAEFKILVDVPEGIDPTKRYVEILKNERRKLLAMHHVELQSIDDRIAKVTALEYKRGRVTECCVRKQGAALRRPPDNEKETY